MKTVSVIGHFGFGHACVDGQTIKTKRITRQLKKLYGDNEVLSYDSHGRVKAFILAPFQLFSAVKNSKNTIMLPAHNGLLIYTPLLFFAHKLFRNRKLFYVVIGGWLPSFLSRRKILCGMLKSFDGIFVETTTMKDDLTKMGFTNVTIMVNFKDFPAEEDVKGAYIEPYRLCMLSRVTPNKGIEDAITIINRINDNLEKPRVVLDIYGPVIDEDKEWFSRVEKRFSQFVSYKGVIPEEQTTSVLKEYYCLLFPTRFFTEGIPGTIIDAYSAGVPVISSRWQSFNDVIIDQVTGFGYEFDNQEDFLKTVLFACDNPDQVVEMKKMCLRASEQYRPENAMKVLIAKLMV